VPPVFVRVVHVASRQDRAVIDHVKLARATEKAEAVSRIGFIHLSCRAPAFWIAVAERSGDTALGSHMFRERRGTPFPAAVQTSRKLVQFFRNVFAALLLRKVYERSQAAHG
jgi:hypothetical protein